MAKKTSTPAWLTTFLLRVAGGINYRKLVKASKNPQQASEATLRGILTYGKDTEFGKEHDFDYILAAKDDKELYKRYAEKIAPSDYEDYRPYIERHKNGDSNVLVPGKPVMYATTSGTTNEPKWIPITDVYLKNVYGKMTKVWLYNYIMNRPKAFYGKLVTIVSKDVEGYAPDGTVAGSVSGVTRRDAPSFVKELYAVPGGVYGIKDYTARYYTIMRLSIEVDAAIFITANPSTLVEVQKNVDKYYDQYCDDIEKGTLSHDFDIPEDIRKEVEAQIEPNPTRAAELRELKKKYGRVLPKHYWPNLQVLNTWKCGNTYVYLDKIKGFFPDCCLHQEFGYFSSECRFGLVMDDTNYTTLFPHYHYYEFIAEEDVDKLNDPAAMKNVKFYQLHELKQGKRYCPFVSTYAGLYRYNMNDLIEVGTPYFNTPRVFMIQKVNGIVTMTGEKLHERQFLEAVNKAAKQMALDVKFFIGFADLSISAYHFYYEFADQNTTQAQCDEFTKLVDKLLSEENIEYKAKRESFRVGDPIGHCLVENSFELFKGACIAEGARDGQFKLNLLLQDEKRHEKFKKLVK
ncbi:MAG: GH3 auxin-responsive promoter family protein [Bacteroidales bacterium]|nr:GH3 auxin-responsive promoter family protein [Bacteroidales bacterium]MEE1080632.1 GH3 auxin-responsive promoter family protein [Bacteroidales bacterium]